jgi:hypothetical protein
MTLQPHEDLIERLRKRAEIRRQIDTRKSVQEGKPDRIADLLDEAASVIEDLSAVYHPKYDAYFYPATGEWIEPRCSDLTCGFCSKRPSNAFV